LTGLLVFVWVAKGRRWERWLCVSCYCTATGRVSVPSDKYYRVRQNVLTTVLLCLRNVPECTGMYWNVPECCWTRCYVCSMLAQGLLNVV
jgi:hypothetical protein